MSTEFFSNSQHHLWQRCRMKDSFFWEDLVEREISLRTLGDLSSLPGRPREISLSLAGSTTAWAVCIFRPIFSPNRELNRSHRVLYFHERSNTDYDYDEWAILSQHAKNPSVRKMLPNQGCCCCCWTRCGLRKQCILSWLSILPLDGFFAATRPICSRAFYKWRLD